MKKVMLRLWVFGWVVKDVVEYHGGCCLKKLKSVWSAVVTEWKLYYRYHYDRLHKS